MTPPACRILITTDAVGGVWVYATELARGLCALGDKVNLVVMGPAPRPEQVQALHTVPGLRIHVTDLALEWLDPEGRDMVRAQEVLLRIAQETSPDVVHLNSFREAAYAWSAPVLLVAHSCVCSWWQACRGGTPSGAHWRAYRQAATAGLNAADLWSAPTKALRDSIEHFYAPPRPGHVIRNGIDLPVCVAPKEPFILAAGRLWDEAKNLAQLERVAPHLDWPVRAAGSARAPGAHDRAFAGLEYLGVLSRSGTLAQMRRASIYASPALYEPFGLSILEAAACGCALVLSDIRSLRELWTGAALFIAPRDTRAWLNALQTLSRNHELRARLQCAARARAQCYGLHQELSAYRDLYRMLTDQSSADRPLTLSAQVRQELPA